MPVLTTKPSWRDIEKGNHYVDQEWKCLLTLEREVRRVGGREEGERERRRERKSDGGS